MLFILPQLCIKFNSITRTLLDGSLSQNQASTTPKFLQHKIRRVQSLDGTAARPIGPRRKLCALLTIRDAA